MAAGECKDKLRLRMSDETGTLRFETLDIVGAPDCREIEATLREYLVGRPLEDVDFEYLETLKCPADGECMHAVIREVQNYQHLFSRKGEDGAATDGRSTAGTPEGTPGGRRRA